jgi:enterochelin esterase-like enzyme
MGIGTGAVSAVYTAYTHPGVFSKVSTQSFVVTPDFHEAFFAEMEKIAGGPEVMVEISTNDYEFTGIDAEADSRRLAKMLDKKGVKVRTRETAGAPGLGHWRGGTADILSWMAPGEKKGDMKP